MGQPRRFIQPYAVRCAEYGSPKDVCVVIPGSQEYVTLHGRRDFAGVLQLRILSWGIVLDCPGGPSVITRIFLRGRAERSAAKVEMVGCWL